MALAKYIKIEDLWELKDLCQTPRLMDVSQLSGEWVNTNPAGKGLSELTIGVANNALSVHAQGGVCAEIGEECECFADAIYCSDIRSSSGSAFTACWESNGARCFLQANQSIGLLIVAGLCRLTKSESRQNYFFREFFRRKSAQIPPAKQAVIPALNGSPSSPSDQAAILESGPKADAFIGTWLNTNCSTGGIKKVEARQSAHGLVARFFGTSQDGMHDWEETKVEPFAPEFGSREACSFLAQYDFGFMETSIHTWIKQGVLVTAKFDRFKDNSGRSNRFSREFFYRI